MYVYEHDYNYSLQNPLSRLQRQVNPCRRFVQKAFYVVAGPLRVKKGGGGGALGVAADWYHRLGRGVGTTKQRMGQGSKGRPRLIYMKR